MANKKKRYEREITLARDRELLRTRFSHEKKLRKVGLKPHLEFFLKANHITYFKEHDRRAEMVELFRKTRYLKNRNRKAYEIFMEIMNSSKVIFSRFSFYEKIVAAFAITSPCRTLESWRVPRSKDEYVIFKSLFLHLLVPYKIPKCAEKAIEHFGLYRLSSNQLEVEIMFHLVKGNGIHQYPKLPIEMNSKMNFLLQQAPAHLDLSQGMWWAKIRSMGASNSIALQLIDNFYVEIDTVWRAWYNDLIFFLNRFPTISKSDLKNILRFIIAQKKDGINLKIKGSNELIWVPALFPEFKFKGRTVDSVLKFVEKWRAYVRLIKEAGVAGVFKVSAVQPMRISQGKKLIRIRQIMNLKNLVLEGNKMNHCVATYAGECLSGTSSIWSMSEILTIGKMKRLITIEVEEKTKKILELSGNSNRDLHEIEKRWLKMWAEKEGLKITEEK